MDALAPVRQARANRAAATLTLEYEGAPAVRTAILERLAQFPYGSLPPLGEGEDREAEIAPMVTSVLGLAVLPWLNPPAQKLLTFVDQGGTLVKGADTLIRRGIKVEVLDALAVGLAAARGEVYTGGHRRLRQDRYPHPQRAGGDRRPGAGRAKLQRVRPAGPGRLGGGACQSPGGQGRGGGGAQPRPPAHHPRGGGLPGGPWACSRGGRCPGAHRQPALLAGARGVHLRRPP